MRNVILACAALLVSLKTTAAATPSWQFSGDDRFKADLLLVVAHPDDESAIGSYLARAIFDQHKRVAVVFGTRGNGGGNAVGQEQSAALGSIREIEGREALAQLGVLHVWFLDAPDTAGQDVLRSLETWDHGRSLGRLVRLVRLTRPQVVATWLPDYVAGENHGDHQASAVLATEAFDLAGDPTQYPEQVTPGRDPRGINNYTEGLQPWQPQKLYFFSDASHTEFLAGQGPEYSSTEVSPSKHVAYELLGAQEVSSHLTQSDSGYAAKVALDRNQVEKTYLHDPSRFVFGKALVPCSRTGDIFEGVQPGPIPFAPQPPFSEATPATSLTFGGSWHFYRQFWAAHSLSHLANLVPPELLAGQHTYITVPLLLTNATGAGQDGKLQVDAPPGWSLQSDVTSFHVDAGRTLPLHVVLIAPGKNDAQWRDIRMTATLGSQSLSPLNLRVQVADTSLPE